MSALSFREQAAIAYLSMSHVVSPEGAASVAQKLADACCAAWGHDCGDGYVVRAMRDGETCRRCGAKP